MANPLTLFQARIRFVDADGRLTPEALRSFAALLERVGGVVGPSISDLSATDSEDNGLEEFKLEQWRRNDACDMTPLAVFEPFTDPMHPLAESVAFTDPMHPLVQQHPDQQALQTELSELREEVARLRSQVDGIMQGTDL